MKTILSVAALAVALAAQPAAASIYDTVYPTMGECQIAAAQSRQEDSSDNNRGRWVCLYVDYLDGWILYWSPRAVHLPPGQL